MESEFGWHILLVEDRREQDMSDEARRNMAMDLLFRRRFEEERQEWLKEIRDEPLSNCVSTSRSHDCHHPGGLRDWSGSRDQAAQQDRSVLDVVADAQMLQERLSQLQPPTSINEHLECTECAAASY